MNNHFRRHWRHDLLIFLVSFIVVNMPAYSAEIQVQEYLLGPGDIISVSVFGRMDLSGEHAVRNSGTVSLPLTGEITVSNLTLKQLEERIADTYAVLMNTESGLPQKFSVNIRIIKHRPFFIIGDVRNPGSYEYKSGLTVIKAIAVAGGYASSGPDARVEESRSRESLNVLMSNYLALIAREARLIAEREELKEITFPPGLQEMSDDPFVAEIIDLEIQLFTVRRELLEQELEIIIKRKLQYAEEDQALIAQAAAVERKRKEVDALLEAVQKLTKQGALSKTELSNMVILQADVERESREIIVSRSRAKQGISQMEQEALILRGERMREVSSELEKARLQIDELIVRLRAEADRLAILNVRTVSSLITPDESQPEKPRVEITRETNDGIILIEATDNTSVYAGDVVSVPHQEGEIYLTLPGRQNRGYVSSKENPQQD